MDCLICKAINERTITIYEDDRVQVLLLSKSFILGHLKIVPKQHYSIFEQVPDELLAYMMVVANKFASILFETLNFHGTNILIQNGVAAGQTISHFSIDIVPRTTGDNLNFNWDMNKASHESLEGMKNIFINALENAPIKEAPKIEKKESKTISNDNDSYLIKQLKHIP